ncbi:hypothetical protein KFU94_71220 [Chloroflexi bacterium TSY]|nr:hypothetical protein [Chloroflexi bacterium TSY]
MRTYQDLGIKPLINASGTITTLGGSIMPKEVIRAMEAAASSFIHLNELHEKVGETLAQMIGVEAAFVSCGAASGMQVSAAACLTGTDPQRVAQLPHTDGWKNEFVISLVDSHYYIHQGIEAVGGTLVKVGTREAVSSEDMLNGIGPETAAIVFFLGAQPKEQLAEIIPEATARNVPIIVDAAAQLPPRSNLTEIAKMGASLVNFSGGKGMRGPQNSGLVVGKAEFVAAARLNSNPYSAIGRGMKVGKEEIMGLLTAVELFLAQDESEEYAQWQAQTRHIAQAVGTIDGVHAEVTRIRQHPTTFITVDDSFGKTVQQVNDELGAGDPSIVCRIHNNAIAFDPMTLMLGEEEVIAQRLIEILT